MTNRPFDVYSSRCPSRAAFDAIFSRWGILVLGFLSERPSRFGEIRRAVDGISEKMLAQTLKALEDEGLVDRREWDEKPPRVEYTLTDAGKKIANGVRDVLSDLYAVMETRRETPR
jgi:DNA-binding HxlR family transcriptional regulator